VLEVEFFGDLLGAFINPGQNDLWSWPEHSPTADGISLNDLVIVSKGSGDGEQGYD
jgi:hypothetical protein